MEKEEGPRSFKALRAKFQEDAALAQDQTRPPIADKPRCFPPPGCNGRSAVSSIHATVETKAPTVPGVILRNGFRAYGGQRPIIFPPQPLPGSPPPQNGAGDSVFKPCFKHMPLARMLPVVPVKERRANPEPPKAARSLPKVRKKGLLLPFKSSKAPKAGAREPVDEPTYADLTTKPLGPVEMSGSESEGSGSFAGERSTGEGPPSSPDVPVTPPFSGELSSPGSGGLGRVPDQRGASTLERAKKRFSPRNFLVYAKPRSVRANGVPLPNGSSSDKRASAAPKEAGNREPYVPPPLPYVPPPLPVCLPPLQCISAIPFSRTNRPRTVSPFLRTTSRDREDPLPARPDEPPSRPPRRHLPELLPSQGPPLKPSRPPLVNLNSYLSYGGRGKEGSPQQEGVARQETDRPLPSLMDSDLRAPDFPDFEFSQMESEGSAPVSAVDLEAMGFGPPSHLDVGALDCDGPHPALAACVPGEVAGVEVQPNFYRRELTSPAVLPGLPGLAGLLDQPAPGFWPQAEETPPALPEAQAEETDRGSAEPAAVSELGSDAALSSEVHSQPSVSEQESYYEACDNVYEEVENINKVIVSQNSRKSKVPKNPYGESPAVKDDVRLNVWPRNPWANNKASGEHGLSSHTHLHSHERHSPDHHEYHKEHKKREKQRLEKEKKEQKEREKKENEMKKKYKVTGLEEPMYHARVIVASKLRKNDLPVVSGDTVSIIRTTNCPKGKWLARDPDHRYGYISVMNVELNIKEMLELGKKAQAAGRGANAEGDTISVGSRSSNHPIPIGSFSDDSEEWTCEDETMSPSENRMHNRTISLPDKLCGNFNFHQTLSYANLEDLHTQTRHEAIQKLSVFFQHNKEAISDISNNGETTATNAGTPSLLCAVEEPPYCEQEGDFADLEFLPPPDLYADTQ